jgi:hypothetical protein
VSALYYHYKITFAKAGNNFEIELAMNQAAGTLGLEKPSQQSMKPCEHGDSQLSVGTFESDSDDTPCPHATSHGLGVLHNAGGTADKAHDLKTLLQVRCW